MAADVDIREGKELEAMLLVAWDRRIKRIEGTKRDPWAEIANKNDYVQNIAKRDGEFEQQFASSQTLATRIGVTEDPFEREKKNEAFKLLYASKIYKDFSKSNNDLFPADQSQQRDHIRTTQTAVKSGYLLDDGKRLMAMPKGEYEQEIKDREAETRAGKAGPSLVPASATAVDTSGADGAEEKMKRLRGTKTIAPGDTLDEREKTLEAISAVTSRPLPPPVSAEERERRALAAKNAALGSGVRT